MTGQDFLDEPPQSPALTAYDRRHMATYARLLDAEADGACWEEIVEVIFGLDPETDPEWASRIYTSHIARARWMSEHGFRHLVRSSYH
ncbi:DNA -binding domain-containing protein [Mesorhizobium xinjiangense]|uniref:DNA -binding domain-containing protein n=1 Tax=Mesorhizobium xinjiangense TaxID=2678685 RepID=UPI0012EE1C65|nr:DUF2285 domain-containing protein [Mesorhizobium xinjiangense]